jgi:XTP/dITP diphosphohydrolase
MRKIVFVTGNKGKFSEAKSILAAKQIELLQKYRRLSGIAGR